MANIIVITDKSPVGGNNNVNITMTLLADLYDNDHNTCGSNLRPCSLLAKY